MMTRFLLAQLLVAFVAPVAPAKPIAFYVACPTNSIGGKKRSVVPLHDIYQRDAAIPKALAELDVVDTTTDPATSDSQAAPFPR